MIKIELNQKLLDKHIQEIKPKLLDKFPKDSSNELLLCVKHNLEYILKAKPEQLKKIIGIVNKCLDKEVYFMKISELNFTDKNTTKEIIENILNENKITLNKKDKGSLLNLLKKKQNQLSFTITVEEFAKKQILEKLKFFINEYDNNWDKIKAYNRYDFVNKLDLKTCPYCNMSYTLIVEKDKDDKNGLRPEIDHFYPKSTYPYLAMSFYNLIPSCKVCNHTKTDKDTFKDKPIAHPYEVQKDDFKLTYIPQKSVFTNVKVKKYNFDSFEIKFKKANKNSLEVFKLEELYKQHKDIVLELLIKKQYYPESYINQLKSFGFSKDEIYRYLFSNYIEDKDLHKRPLSKLIKDISEELKLI